MPAELVLLPPSEEPDEEIAAKPLVQELRQKVNVRDERTLKDDWHVGGVEELDRVVALVAALRLGLDWEVDPESLEVDDDHEDDDGGQEVEAVWQVASVKSFLDGLHLVAAGEREVEERHERALELGAATPVDRLRRERLPHDRLADVGGDEERHSRPESIALLQKLVQQGDDDGRQEELANDHGGLDVSDVVDGSVHAGDHVRHRLADADDETHHFVRRLKQLHVLWDARVHFDQFRSGEQLHHET
mmetsp:Transcript_20271/g.42960  ORF Transcript_20271/g.42960 Transcript_20271/m.42960 type:complete len:247 (+) Transcript_20271:513-1253(+)